MREILKLTAYRTAKLFGTFTAVANSRWRRNRLAILCYHGFALDDEHRWSPHLYMTAEALRRRLEALRRSAYTILPLEEALNRLHDGSLPKRSVVLTFDDGFVDFYRLAMPLLQEYRVPATVYVSSYYSFLERPVFDPMLAYLLWKGAAKTLSWPEAIGEPVCLTSQGQNDARQRLAAFASKSGLSGQEKDGLLRELAGRVAVDYDDLVSRRLLQLMNAAELRDLVKEGFDLQLHTHRHRVPQDRELFVKEIEDNRRALDVAGQGHGVYRHFCYPSGVYYPESGEFLRQCGVLSATTCDPGLASTASDFYYLPRFCDSMNVPDIAFEGWVSGLSSLLPRRMLGG